MVESLLSVVILFTIASGLIPISYHMKSTLYNKKMELHASEVAYEAVNIVLKVGTSSGMKTIEDVEYHWLFDGKQICVEFNNLNEERLKCIDQDGEL